ncbi:TRAP transporter small permease [Roseinatronobacter alkalisoli]|uniref:TRAP transporter small permease protein n=1 Tax=Roseinatronobacter alkalisoli TaxID=3028235 RepID=A0ABT5TB06_9RHOB|nr:TRAP transporter small permease [Roseinatronobacter sp. HJB301]MDD7972264.1 TRAP transporter small permease [Roseinatronobacter sp. HJB301]
MQGLRKLAHWLSRGAEALAALMLAVMFGAFLVTILFRYVLNWPSGGAAELSSVMWVWLVLFGAGFVLRERDEIRFDIVYGSVPSLVRRVFFVIAAVGVVGLFMLSLPAVWDYVTFMKVQRTAYLRIRYDWLFSVYVLFAVAVILRYLWLAGCAVAGHDPIAPEQQTSAKGD